MEFKQYFKDKCIFVLGASSGIGIEICKHLLSYNATVIMHYNTNEKEIAILQKEYPQSIKVKFNIKDEQEIKKVTSKLFSQYKIDAFINCVGIMIRSFIPLTSKESFNNIVTTNLIDAFVVLKYVSLEMIKNKTGSILNVSSLAGSHGLKGQAAYSASKAGLDAVTRVLSKELSMYNIRVNGIAPGFIDTGILAEPKEQDLAFKEKIPLKRFGTAAEVAHLTCFLISDYSSYITGQTIKIDGGLSNAL
ncbi:MAG: SDR family oxidoreductase [Dysgonamonadaceae bacterium]|jgi:3-oxoacyl-[acyl-carrier protein] reductase|nr:SDR family oxidoreductase [Dysgonamonadaceae bacterium]